jgi:hypothetical protein
MLFYCVVVVVEVLLYDRYQQHRPRRQPRTLLGTFEFDIETSMQLNIDLFNKYKYFRLNFIPCSLCVSIKYIADSIIFLRVTVPLTFCPTKIAFLPIYMVNKIGD